jgi:hypothetical protein
MQTQTISEDQWVSFIDGFSRDHLGWPVTIEVLDQKAGPQNVAENLPLQGISFDCKGTRPSSIEINAGAPAGDAQVNHVVDLPLHIRQAQESNGNIDIQIEPADGPVTLLHVHSPTQ